MLAKGSWWVRSKKDERWNYSGRGLVGMFGVPEEAKKWIEKMKTILGEPPEDLEFGYMKD